METEDSSKNQDGETKEPSLDQENVLCEEPQHVDEGSNDIKDEEIVHRKTESTSFTKCRQERQTHKMSNKGKIFQVKTFVWRHYINIYSGI